MIILQCNDYRRLFLLPKLNGNSMNHFIKLKNVSCLLLGTLLGYPAKRVKHKARLFYHDSSFPTIPSCSYSWDIRPYK